jgi:hypothetical protein
VSAIISREGRGRSAGNDRIKLPTHKKKAIQMSCLGTRAHAGGQHKADGVDHDRLPVGKFTRPPGFVFFKERTRGGAG